MLMVLVFIAGLWAGLQNALAGGGSFITLPVLMLTGMTPLAANITSTVALFPAQVTSGLAGRRLVSGAGALPWCWALAPSSAACWGRPRCAGSTRGCCALRSCVSASA